MCDCVVWLLRLLFAVLVFVFFLKYICWKCACVRCVLLCARVLDAESDTLCEECSGLFVLLSFVVDDEY